jgi:hypothetical protein
MKKRAYVPNHRYCLLAVTLALLSLSTRSLVAETREVTAARELFRAGRRSVAANDYAIACPKFQESYALDPAVGTLLNIADCDRRAGRTATAWAKFRHALEQLVANDDRRPSVQRVIVELEQRLPKLTILLEDGAPSVCSVERDGTTINVDNLGVSTPVDPGEHVVVVNAPGYLGKRYEFSVSDGQAKVIIGEPGDRVAQASDGVMSTSVESASNSVPSNHTADATMKTEIYSTEPRIDAHSAQSDSGQRQVEPLKVSRLVTVQRRDEGPTSIRKSNSSLVYAVGTIGVVGIVLGTATRIAAFSKQDTIDAHCPNKECDDVGWNAVSFSKRMQTVSTISLITGATAIGTGLYFAIANGENKKQTAVAIQTMLLPGKTTGLGIKGSF